MTVETTSAGSAETESESAPWGEYSLHLHWLSQWQIGFGAIPWLGMATLWLGKFAVVATWPVDFLS